MLRKLKELKLPEWFCLIEAALVLALTRASLPIVGLKNVRRLLGPATRGFARTSSLDERNILRLLGGASRVCPIGSTCLTGALTGQVLVRGAGIETRLCVGVMRDAQNQFQAHAWLERDSRVILGGSHEEIGQWIPLGGVDERTA